MASASLGAELREISGLTIEQLLDKPFYLTERDANYRRVLDRFLASRKFILNPLLECSNTSFIIRMLENHRGISLLPWYAVEQSVEQGRLSLVNVPDFHDTLYLQIFSHKEKWRTRRWTNSSIWSNTSTHKFSKNKRPASPFQAMQVSLRFHSFKSILAQRFIQNNSSRIAEVQRPDSPIMGS